MIQALPRLFRLAFWGAVVVTLLFALTPHPPDLLSNDKSQHELAFAVLTITAFMAYPRLRWYWVVGAMAALGALIEILQAIPALHRDSDIMDWIADMKAVAVTIALCLLVKWLVLRRRVS